MVKKKHTISFEELSASENPNAETTKTSFDIPSESDVETLRKSDSGIINQKYGLDYSNTETRTVMAFRIPNDDTFKLLGYLAELEGKSNTDIGNAILTHYFSQHKDTIIKDYQKLLKSKLSKL